MRGLKRSLMLLVAAMTCVALPSGGYASTVVTWNGSDSFNGTTVGLGDEITFTGFTASQLTLVTGDGQYEGSSSSSTTNFSLWLDLNGTWTSIESWSTNDNTLRDLSAAFTLPKNFASATVTGIALTAAPADGGNDTNFQSFINMSCEDDRCTSNPELFTFNSVTTTPLPGALALFGSVLFGGLGVSTWRRRRSSRGTTSVLA